MISRNKKGKFTSKLTKENKETIKKWIAQDIEKPRLLGKIMLHFGVYEKTANKWLKDLLDITVADDL